MQKIHADILDHDDAMLFYKLCLYTTRKSVEKLSLGEYLLKLTFDLLTNLSNGASNWYYVFRMSCCIWQFFFFFFFFFFFTFVNTVY
jgi:hypothetical protein